MSERYVNLFALSENLYTVGSPVILSAGHLLKDNQTGKILAQLKIKNLSDKTIKAAKVRIHSQDTTGKPIGEEEEKEYLDLQAGQGDEFGQKVAIALSNTSTRAFSAEITQVIFVDNSTWEALAGTWRDLPKSKYLQDELQDPELVKQYRVHYGEDSLYIPQEDRDLWLCTCGEWNKEESCYHCGKQKNHLLPFDLVELEEEKNKRLIEEKAEADRRAVEAEKKKEALTAKAKKSLPSLVVPCLHVL